ncbi:hypothetical protein BDZ85DRAFT_88548 [Elsinoe ampelina]|uniref:Uncharacterized protein n=1 Tax=Elsinoe ampelina TaxID=302913 RepID=A0A6A6GHK4_9PEZI|nr:hypothetical protein BDZ85DRAFT_88548 [Elsinoe ampelina]
MRRRRLAYCVLGGKHQKDHRPVRDRESMAPRNKFDRSVGQGRGLVAVYLSSPSGRDCTCQRGLWAMISKCTALVGSLNPDTCRTSSLSNPPKGNGAFGTVVCFVDFAGGRFCRFRDHGVSIFGYCASGLRPDCSQTSATSVAIPPRSPTESAVEDGVCNVASEIYLECWLAKLETSAEA